MAKITATGTPVKYPDFGDVRIQVDGDEVDIMEATFLSKKTGEWAKDEKLERQFREDVKEGPTYPLCAEPFTMRCALFVLFEWFGEADSCWVEEPKHVILDGEIEPMESEPGVIY